MGATWLSLMLALGQAQAEPALAPSGKWRVEYAENMCTASRQYGTGDQAVTVGVRTLPLATFVDIVLITPGRLVGRRDGTGTVTIGASGAPIEAIYTSWGLKDQGFRISTVQVMQGHMDDLATATEMTIAVGNEAPVRIAPRSTAAAFAALDKCQDDLLLRWGINSSQRALVIHEATPTTNEADWINSNDYPSQAVRAGLSGTSTILWTIDTEGGVKNCRVVATSGSQVLDRAACIAITARARYKPAVGRDGVAIESHKTRRVMWVATTG